MNLIDSLTLESGTGDINFGNGIGFVSGPAAGLTIDSTGTTTLADTVNVLSIATDAGGVTRLGSAVTTSGNTQVYNDAVVLTKDAVLSSPNSSITFASTVDSDSTARTLELSAGGNISFNSAVGSLSKLASLTLAQAFAVEAQSTLAIDGTGRDLNGLLIESGVNNVTMTQAGSTIESAGNASIRFAGGSANTQLAGFTATDGDGTGLMAGPGSYANSSVTASSFTVTNGTGFAVDLNNAQGLTVGGSGGSSNIFKNSIYGGGAAGDLTGTSVIGNSFEDVVVGFRLNDAENFSLSGTNTFDSYSATPLDSSVRPEGSTTPAPSQPTIYGPAARTGLYAIGESSGTVVAGNEFENGFGGLTIAEAKNLTINGNNTIEVFDDTGITVYGDVTGTTIENNTIVGNTSATDTVGLRLVDAQNLSASNNTFSEVTTGVLAEGDLSGTVLSDNTFDGANGTTGVRITGSNLKLERNIIRNFTGNGIEVDGNIAINNAFLENSIFGNAFGIDLIDGANGGQTAPELEDVTRAGGSITVNGNITTADGDYRLEVYRNLGIDEVGIPVDEYAFQGRIYLGSAELTVTGGEAAVNVTVPVTNPGLGGWITMTATSLTGESVPLNTSEFSKGIRMPRAALGAGSRLGSFGVGTIPEARLFNVGDLSLTNINPRVASHNELISTEVSTEPLLTVSAHGEGSSNLSAVYGTEFATTFLGGLRVANADLNGDGYDELITVPGALPAGTADTFGNALRTVGIFNSDPNGTWTTASIDLTDVYGDRYTDGFTVTLAHLLPADEVHNPFEAPQIVVSSCVPNETFNGAVAYSMTNTSRGDVPTIAHGSTRLQTPNILEPIFDVTAGKFENGELATDSLVVATSAGGRSSIEVFQYDTETNSTTLGTVASFSVSLSLNQRNGVAVDVFGNGLSLTAGDMDGDSVEELIIGAGASGMGNFRAISGDAIMAGIQSAFDAQLAMIDGPFGNGVTGGRYADFTPVFDQNVIEQVNNLDFFYEQDVPGLTGMGFNSPMSVRAVDLDGDELTELFVTIGGVNSSNNLVKSFAFSESTGWSLRQGFKTLDLDSGSFRQGDGSQFG